MTSQAFVFDAYGTLFDVHAAIGRHRAAAGPDAERLSELWRIKQLEYTWTLTLAGHYEDFWTLTGRALDFALTRFPAVDRAIKPALMEAYRTLDAFADARAILQALKTRGHATAILSNGSPVMLSAAVDGADLGRDLDAVLSVDAIRMYKPRPEVYRLRSRPSRPSGWTRRKSRPARRCRNGRSPADRPRGAACTSGLHQPTAPRRGPGRDSIRRRQPTAWRGSRLTISRSRGRAP